MPEAVPGYRYFISYRVVPVTWFGRAKWGNVIAQAEKKISTEDHIRIIEQRISRELPPGCRYRRVIIMNYRLMAEVQDIAELNS